MELLLLLLGLLVVVRRHPFTVTQVAGSSWTGHECEGYRMTLCRQCTTTVEGWYTFAVAADRSSCSSRSSYNDVYRTIDCCSNPHHLLEHYYLYISLWARGNSRPAVSVVVQYHKSQD